MSSLGGLQGKPGQAYARADLGECGIQSLVGDWTKISFST